MTSTQYAKVARTIAYVAGGGCAGIFVFLAVASPRNAPLWAGASAMLISIAGLLGIWFPPPARAVVQDAPVVTPSGAPTGATNVSTSSDVFERKVQLGGHDRF